jgi:hypothetical protein
MTVPVALRVIAWLRACERVTAIPNTAQLPTLVTFELML